jgi:hypothetical protein
MAIEKFGVKYFVWQTICQRILRKNKFATGIISTEEYTNKYETKDCYFLRKHNSPISVWADFASALIQNFQ